MTDNSQVPGRTREWIDSGTALFTQHADALDDAGCSAATSLPDWTRGHVLAHVAGNARALGRLVEWARTGVESRMYPSREARDEEIERDARLPAADLRQLVRDSAGELSRAMWSLPEERWNAQVVTGQGRTVAARVVPWLRCREVWIHAVDLGTGVTYHDFPADLVDALLTDLVDTRLQQGREPALVLRPSDRERSWPHDGDLPNAVTVTGPAAGLACWLTGRGGGEVGTMDGTPLPDLGRWL